jgi:hypothetical protein
VHSENTDNFLCAVVNSHLKFASLWVRFGWPKEYHASTWPAARSESSGPARYTEGVKEDGKFFDNEDRIRLLRIPE